MTLQTVFYIMGIVYMSLNIICLVVILAILVFIKMKIAHIAALIEGEITKVKEIVSHPQDLAASVGAAVVDTAINQASKFITSHKKHHVDE